MACLPLPPIWLQLLSAAAHINLFTCLGNQEYELAEDLLASQEGLCSELVKQMTHSKSKQFIFVYTPYCKHALRNHINYPSLSRRVTKVSRKRYSGSYEIVTSVSGNDDDETDVFCMGATKITTFRKIQMYNDISTDIFRNL